eukprot:snap_masked-scaffold_2-processed-gene-15.6-mRNA-1 protein AED:1.00 eAED:1.00 QI:0/-1/0/0/-1/1/1/0/119
MSKLSNHKALPNSSLKKQKRFLTYQEKRARNVESVRRHRKRVRIELEIAYEKEDLLKDEVEVLRAQIQRLRQHLWKLERNNNLNLWSRRYLLNENLFMREINRSVAQYQAIVSEVLKKQ